MAPQAQLSGIRKAAVLLVQLGTERSAPILAAMRETEVEEVMAEIAQLDTIESDVVDNVLAEFQELLVAQRYFARGGMGFARELLESSMGADKAREVLERLNASLMELPFQFLRKADPRQILSFMQDEHPQTIALVLSHMGADQAAIVLGELPQEMQADVAHRVAIMERTSPDVIRQVESTLERKLSTVLQPTEMSAVGGLQPLVDIINRADRTTERLILEALDERDPELAEQLRSQMFVFEDITLLDDRSIQLVLRQVEAVDLATALKGVRADVREKVLSNMSERAGANLVEEIELLGPVRLTVVEEAQAKIVHTIRQLEETGQITISRGGEDEFVA
jgi:flagellar motor switch protein FliG